jgi:hypothetical protein
LTFVENFDIIDKLSPRQTEKLKQNDPVQSLGKALNGGVREKKV